MEELFYNRDRNLTGFAMPLALGVPNMGYSMNFKSESSILYYDNNIFKVNNYGINNLKVSSILSWKTSEFRAGNFINHMEENNSNKFSTINIDPNVYNNNINAYCDGYSLNHINNENYNLSAKFSDFNYNPDLSWSGSSILNVDFNNWENSQEYSRNDIIYTGVSDVKINNFYYCTGDHTSSQENSPTGSNSHWTKDFFWEPDASNSNSVDFSVSKVGASYKHRSKSKINNSYVDLDYRFTNISTSELKAILHFLEKKAGFRRFFHQIPSLYNRPKIYICTEWSHTFVFNDCHNLSVKFKEDPMGVHE